MSEGFNPCELTEADRAAWVRAGDINEAELVANDLALFLSALADNNDAVQAIMKAGVPWIGSETAKLISERLLEKPPQKNGKVTTTGAERFAKVLVPNKPTKAQFTERWLAAVAYRLLASVDDTKDGPPIKDEFKTMADIINAHIDTNNNHDGVPDSSAIWRHYQLTFSPAFPDRKVTANQIEKAYRKHKEGIDAANGILIHKTR